MEDWTEKYRPRSLADVVGNSKAISQIRDWADAWESGEPPKKRALILAGEPGVGKTSAAHALARDYGWGVIEMNASDQRNYDVVRRIATSGAVNRAFTESGEYNVAEQGRQVVILDEADNLFGREDRGGMRAILETIREAKQPIILIVNDLYETYRKGASLRGLTEEVKFTRVYTRSIPKALRGIAREEGLEVEPGVLEAIAERSRGNLRSAVNDLQAIAAGRQRVEVHDVDALGPRDVTEDIFSALKAILYGSDVQEARRSVWDIDESPEDVLLWVDENMPIIYRDPADRVEGATAVARADAYLGRARRKQQFRLWSYANDMMTAGVAVAKTSKPKGARFQFPSWLKKMSRSRGARGTRDGVAAKLGEEAHTSKAVARQDLIPTVRALMQGDAEVAARFTAGLELTADEVAFLLETKATTKRVKKVMERAEELAEERAEALDPFAAYRARRDDAQAALGDDGVEEKEESAPAPEPTSDDDAASDGGAGGDASGDDAAEDDDPASQRSLFDF